MTKRFVDVLAALVGLVVLWPLLVVIAIGVKATSRGPVLFAQERIGKAGKPFRIYKFRSMAVAAGGALLTVGRDPRVTAFGSFLRQTKLDELPQLFNILRGDMSVVGPRPEVAKYVALYPHDVRERVLSIRPGLTDQAALVLDEQAILAKAADPEVAYVSQVLPSKLAIQQRYVETRTLLMDFKIIVRTVLRIALRRR